MARTAKAASKGYAGSADIALVLHTSGTTSRPKIVPLSHGNVCASAAHIAATLKIPHEDRCFNIMPLVHIHGLIAAVLSTFAAAGSVFCTPRFHALRFFQCLEIVRAHVSTPVTHA